MPRNETQRSLRTRSKMPARLVTVCGSHSHSSLPSPSCYGGSGTPPSESRLPLRALRSHVGAEAAPPTPRLTASMSVHGGEASGMAKQGPPKSYHTQHSRNRPTACHSLRGTYWKENRGISQKTVSSAAFAISPLQVGLAQRPRASLSVPCRTANTRSSPEHIPPALTAAPSQGAKGETTRDQVVTRGSTRRGVPARATAVGQ